MPASRSGARPMRSASPASSKHVCAGVFPRMDRHVHFYPCSYLCLAFFSSCCSKMPVFPLWSASPPVLLRGGGFVRDNITGHVHIPKSLSLSLSAPRFFFANALIIPFCPSSFRLFATCVVIVCRRWYQRRPQSQGIPRASVILHMYAGCHPLVTVSISFLFREVFLLGVLSLSLSLSLSLYVPPSMSPLPTSSHSRAC